MPRISELLELIRIEMEKKLFTKNQLSPNEVMSLYYESCYSAILKFYESSEIERNNPLNPLTRERTFVHEISPFKEQF